MSHRIAVCSGSFDPVTIGHVDIFERASRMFDELVVCVFHNVRKKDYFSIDERRRFLEEATAHLSNVRVDAFSGLLTDYMKEIGAQIIVRGVRSVKDLEYEENEAHMLHHLDASVETVFLLTNPAYSFVSSSGIRELAAFHGDVHGLVPPCVEAAVNARIAADKNS
ncbi:pantetheine-phosphate adenylyltransferase [uncultured Selenomonas sp.]|uniref:pantetheine-phosphate adenylyltransferase n=1 Tax=uncultured Selenomonas sp. TaxID=159275 RepID=UPI0025D97F73|nr:pantetheine-phosphate adenylyltransferase [uncultured Selenomonas sp.]